MYTNNRRRGAALGLSVVLCFFLLAMLLGLFWLSMYFGGSREAKTAGDAGALNVGKQTATLQIQLQPGDETTNFADVTDTNGSGNVSLTNINRIWAKALLCALNGQQMTTDGTIGSGESNVQQMQNYASEISGRLAAQLSDPTNLTNFYTQYAQQNSTRMMGTGSGVQVTDEMDWSTSFLDQPAGGNPAGTPYESNVQFNATAQLPPNYPASSLTLANSKNDPTHTYLAGYLPYTVMGMNFWQVPFRYGERPHLVAKTEFTQYSDPNKLGPPGWTPNAVPNAFATLGATANNRQYSALAAAWVQTNPQKTWTAAMPNGYIIIQIDNNQANWFEAGLTVPMVYPTETTNYDFTPGQDFTLDDPVAITTISLPPIPGTLNPEAILGDEYLSGALGGPTVLQAIYADGPSNNSSAQSFQYMLQRVNEFHPGTSASDLSNALGQQTLQSSGTQVFVLHNANENDCTSALTLDSVTNGSPPSWCQTASFDGTQQSMESEDSYSGGFDFSIPTPGCPNIAECSPTNGDDAIIVINCGSTRTWTPGTGYSSTPGQGGCLGQLEVQNYTTIDYAVVGW
jgi:hypothetical protein